ncbi:MAG: hypothetical protein PVI03_03200 [Candidatus Thorarchaeota archaeon]|jgi:hypothetical protein
MKLVKHKEQPTLGLLVFTDDIEEGWEVVLEAHEGESLKDFSNRASEAMSQSAAE